MKVKLCKAETEAGDENALKSFNLKVSNDHEIVDDENDTT